MAKSNTTCVDNIVQTINPEIIVKVACGGEPDVVTYSPSHMKQLLEECIHSLNESAGNSKLTDRIKTYLSNGSV